MGRRHRQGKRRRYGPAEGPAPAALPLYSPAELLDRARLRLDRREAREAGYLVRQAQREAAAPLDGADLLLLIAYSLRCRQLEARGLAREAAEARDLAHRLRPALERLLPAEDHRRALALLDLPDALALLSTPPCPADERLLADRVVVSRRFADLEALPPEHGLRKDGEVLGKALPAMEAGDWAAAAGAMAPIGRRSPYAPWRTFARAMAAWAAEDHEALRQAVDLLPEDFVLAKAARELLAASAGTPAQAGPGTIVEGPAQRVRALLGLPGAVQDLVSRLTGAIRGNNPREVEELIPRLAAMLSPGEPEAAAETLVDILSLAARQGRFQRGLLPRVARRVLPPGRARVASVRGAMLAEMPQHDRLVVDPVSAYLDLIPGEFPGEESRDLARACVLEQLARDVVAAEVCPGCIGPRALDAALRVAGDAAGTTGTIPGDLMLASLRADPRNREGYRFLLPHLAGSSHQGEVARQLMRQMAEVFPDDPEPCLEMATLHYRRNAYRRAEEAVEEAARRAPHDDRVLDYQALAYLASADRARSRASRDRVEQDLARAEARGRRRLETVVWVKRQAFRILQGEPVAGLEAALEGVSEFERLRRLALLTLDLAWCKGESGPADEVRRRLEKQGDRLDRLGPAELVALLAPVDPAHTLVFPSRQVAPLLACFWPRLLEAAPGDHFFELADLLIPAGGAAAVRAAIDRRLAGSPRGERDALLLLYLAFLRHREGRERGFERFRDAVSRAGAAGRPRLQAAAGRLARLAHGPLAEALRRFDFDEHTRPALEDGGPGTKDPFGDLGEEESGDEEGPKGGGSPEALVRRFEDLIDRAGLRGAPELQLQAFGRMMRSATEHGMFLDLFAFLADSANLALSREARVILSTPVRRPRR